MLPHFDSLPSRNIVAQGLNHRKMRSCFGRNAADSKVSISNCDALARIVETIKYYISVQANMDDQATQHIAMEIYINEQHKNLLDDYTHVITTHSQHLQQINEQLDDCNLIKCKMGQKYRINRRRADNNQMDNDESNNKLKFRIELIEIIHFWLYHLYDVGMRVKRNDGFDDEMKGDNGYFDHEFARLKKCIIGKRELNMQDEHQIIQNNKYTMKINTNIDNLQRDTDQEKPFMDMFRDSLNYERVSLNAIDSFTQYIKSECYDTDAFIADIFDFEKGSNIIETLTINDHQFTDFIKEYAADLNSMCMLNTLLVLLTIHYNKNDSQYV